MRKGSGSVNTLIETPMAYIEPYGIYAKLERFNLTGSIKDRPAYFMLMHALKENLVSSGGTIIEPTSGNTGIALAALGSQMGIKVVLTMPASVTPERVKLAQSYGAQVLLTPADEGMSGAIKKAQELKEERHGYIPDQFNNPFNTLAHELTTGPEILKQMNWDVQAFVAGVGSGGTITGVGKVLKKALGNKVKIVAVEPAESPVLSGGKPGSHIIQGIGAGFVPTIFDENVIDDIVLISGEEAMNGVKMLNERGFSVGVSSGANFMASLKVKEHLKLKNVVTVFPDDGLKYLSMF
ncbi:PLP-dependent cysteine synthase family protein [Coprothermobacter platensis]|uniref:PLP-dependent cysteine synthase family protein n=1 Tax=Coprothermobacter platensis TaxID=108819 RepID=UPI00036F6419|nr:cysteine synthase family protein [Coprothermobacter platensis]